MEEVLPSIRADESTSIPTIEGNAETMSSEPMQMAIDSPTTIVEVVVPVIETPQVDCDEVKMEQVEVEQEEPILPDHYYDGGNIPVFKPVCLPSICHTYTNLILDNGSVSRFRKVY